MILTEISTPGIAESLAVLSLGLADVSDRAALARIGVTSTVRASGKTAIADRARALALARGFGMTILRKGADGSFNWNGAALNPATEAYVVLHEIGHFLLAPPERRSLVEFGLGPGPDTKAHEAAEQARAIGHIESAREEACASLLGILWEVELGQPALASFLDQNWLEGLARGAAALHFAEIAAALRAAGMADAALRPVMPRRRF